MPSSQTGWPDGTQAGAGGGGGAAPEVRQNGVPVVASPTSINFINGFTVTNPAGDEVEIAPPIGGGGGGQSTGITWVVLPLANGDFETGDATGWTIDVGAARVADWSAMTDYDTAGMTGPNNGTYFFNGGEAASGGDQAAVEGYQDISLVGDDGFAYFVEADAYKNWADSDVSFVELELRNGSDVIYASRRTAQSVALGSEKLGAMLLAHKDATTLRVRIGCLRNAGSSNNSGLDNVVVRKAQLPTASPPVFLGARTELTTSTTIPATTETAVVWDGTTVEEGGDWWTAGQPTRLTVPNGVAFVNITAGTYSDTAQASTADYVQRIKINGMAVTVNIIDDQIWGPPNITTGVIAVTPGDYIEYTIWCTEAYELQESVTFLSVEAAATENLSNDLSQEEETASFSVDNADFNGNILKKCNSASAIVVTVPSGLSPKNECSIIRHGAGAVTVAAGGGVTILSADGNLALRAQYSSASLVPTGTANEYYLVGDLA